MPLESGSKLGPYEIRAPIGAGGMGEVYQATDTRLDRTVAIKVLPEDLAESPERKRRFEREAKAISKLNHPHICTLHDIGHQGGVDFLVMEHIEGETLAEKLKRGPLPIAQALEYGIQLADGLDKAHRAGIVHRDLKPGNIIIGESGVKILDFGLARVTVPERVSEASDAPTREHSLTGDQTILGTLHYMAPEQLEGKTVDERADIWALGALLHEMITGRRPFDATSQASLVAAILEKPAKSISELEPMSPATLDRVVERCLAKDPESRWRSVRDLQWELEWYRGDLGAAATMPARTVRAPVAWLLIGAAAISGATWLLTRTAPAPNSVTKLNLGLAGENLYLDRYGSLAISDDGRQIAFVGRTGSDAALTPPGSGTQLFLRSFDEFESRLLAGTEGAYGPFFAPDGQWVGFFTEQQLKKVAVTGGPPVVICDLPFVDVSAYIGGSADWASDNTIFFSINEGLQRVPANGGQPETLTHPDIDRGEVGHAWPSALPESSAVLFTVWTRDNRSRVALYSLSTGEWRTFEELGEGEQPHYAKSGHLVYSFAGSVWAVGFDLETLEPTGVPAPITGGIANNSMNIFNPDANSTGLFRITHYDTSDGGALVYAPGNAFEPESIVVWVDRDGRETPLSGELGSWAHPALSPDGRWLAVVVGERNRHIAVVDIERDTRSPLTFEGDNSYPVWTPDGTRIAYGSNRDDRAFHVYWKSVDGSGDAEPLLEGDYSTWPQSWTPEGDALVFYEAHPERSREIGVLEIPPLSSPSYIVSGPASERGARVSPDGRWLAYVSNESGRDEVYVTAFPDSRGKWQISTDGGSGPRWSPDGGEIIYRRGQAFMSVRVDTEPRFTSGRPAELFAGPYELDAAGRGNYDISPDGTRFVAVRSDDPTRDGSEPNLELRVILNWNEEMKRSVDAR